MQYVCICSRFGLFEAMSAIEMMDPKMDAGMIFNKEKTIKSFKEAIEVNLLFQISTSLSSNSI
jgi:hypothetical protein